MSQERASSVPPPKANPSTIAMVGFDRFQTASQALSSKNGRTSSESLPANSEMSAPAANAGGLGLLPSSVSKGGDPRITMHLTLSSDSTRAHCSLIS